MPDVALMVLKVNVFVSAILLQVLFIKRLWDKYTHTRTWLEVMEEMMSLGQRQRDADFNQKMLEVSGQRGASSRLRRAARGRRGAERSSKTPPSRTARVVARHPDAIFAEMKLLFQQPRFLALCISCLLLW